MKTDKINPIIREAAKTIKCKPVGKTVPKELQFVEHIGVSNNANIKMHIAKLEKYLEKHPNDIEVRTQVARLKEMVK